MKLSNRLLTCCDYVNYGDRVADVGTDHGYLGIHLLRTGRASQVIASDIHPAPLESARSNAVKYGVADRMTFCLSDGLSALPRDFDTLVCAGMGADTMIHILSMSPWLKKRQYRLILQCQSRRPELRRWLSENGYTIHRETLARDGRFYYPVMEVLPGAGPTLTPGQCYLSPALLESGSPLLGAYVRRVIEGMRESVAGLSRSGGEKYQEYLRILEELLEMEAKIHDNGG